jgi:hypothetical protein
MLDKFGYNPSVSNTVFEDVWYASQALTYPTVARTLTVDSSGNDNGTGSTGANEIMIQGLDANWNEIKETVVLNATVSPTTTNEFIRVNRAFVTTVGSLGVNENDITLTTTTDLDLQANIGAGLGQTEKSHLSVPAGFKCKILAWSVNCGKGDDFDVILETREFGESWRIRQRALIFQNNKQNELDISIGEKGDVRIRAKGSGVDRPLDVNYRYIFVRI